MKHPQFPIRPATLDDVPTLVEHRRAMFYDMGQQDDRALDAMCAAFDPWTRQKMPSGEYLAWLAIAPDGAVAAGAGLWLMDWPPHLIGPGARRGNILNVYTQPEYRRRGLARRLTQTALDWCRGNGIRAVILHASDDGRALYESLGFEPTNEMRILIEPPGQPPPAEFRRRSRR
ncbi:MAG: GNAT family N-acetyltransferase [Bryobacteraceae bacterium]